MLPLIIALAALQCPCNDPARCPWTMRDGDGGWHYRGEWLHWECCLDGPNVVPDCDCRVRFDLDGDLDVDMRDMAEYMRRWA